MALLTTEDAYNSLPSKRATIQADAPETLHPRPDNRLCRQQGTMSYDAEVVVLFPLLWNPRTIRLAAIPTEKTRWLLQRCWKTVSTAGGFLLRRRQGRGCLVLDQGCGIQHTAEPVLHPEFLPKV